MKTVSGMGRFPPTIKLKDEAVQLRCSEFIPAVTSAAWSIYSRYPSETFGNLMISIPVVSETSMVYPRLPRRTGEIPPRLLLNNSHARDFWHNEG